MGGERVKRAAYPRLLGEPTAAELTRERYGVSVSDLERERYGSVDALVREMYYRPRRKQRAVPLGPLLQP
jgi:hypothetical protein